MNDSPKFYAVVELNGKKIATVKAQTHNDTAEIQERCFKRRGETFDVNIEKMNIIRIRQALTGDPKVGWESDKSVTEDNISMLSPETYNAILLKIQELDKSWQDKDLEKN